MYCPKCGQSQVSADVRFCSRCGFLLEGASSLLASGGLLPAAKNTGGDDGQMSPRRRGARQGGKLLMLGIFFVPLFAILHELIGTPEKLPLIGVLFIIAGIMRLIFARFFEEGASRTRPVASTLYTPPQTAPPRMSAPAQETLPPAPGTPAYNYRRPQANTSEIMQPHSVTDHTTRLLEKESDPTER
ncbi:MAG: zinc ribbon domain-containing protein [Pyrinomonadaceae bacterium]